MSSRCLQIATTLLQRAEREDGGEAHSRLASWAVAMGKDSRTSHASMPRKRQGASLEITSFFAKLPKVSADDCHRFFIYRYCSPVRLDSAIAAAWIVGALNGRPLNSEFWRWFMVISHEIRRMTSPIYLAFCFLPSQLVVAGFVRRKLWKRKGFSTEIWTLERLYTCTSVSVDFDGV